MDLSPIAYLTNGLFTLSSTHFAISGGPRLAVHGRIQLRNTITIVMTMSGAAPLQPVFIHRVLYTVDKEYVSTQHGL